MRRSHNPMPFKRTPKRGFKAPSGRQFPGGPAEEKFDIPGFSPTEESKVPVKRRKPRQKRSSTTFGV